MINILLIHYSSKITILQTFYNPRKLLEIQIVILQNILHTKKNEHAIPIIIFMDINFLFLIKYYCCMLKINQYVKS